MKVFLKQFLIWLAIFTVILTPVTYYLDKLGDVRVFQGTENLMDELDVIVDPKSPFFEAFRDSERVNILLLGVNDGLSDTIMLGSYDMKNQRVDVISFREPSFDGGKLHSKHTKNKCNFTETSQLLGRPEL